MRKTAMNTLEGFHDRDQFVQFATFRRIRFRIHQLLDPQECSAKIGGVANSGGNHFKAPPACPAVHSCVPCHRQENALRGLRSRR